MRRYDWRRRRRRNLAIWCCSRPVERCRGVVVDDKHRRVPSPTHHRVPRRAASWPAADARAEARHHLGGQHLAKASVEDGVDWEVDCRVGDDEHVTDAAVVELKATTVACGVIQDVPEDLIE